MTPNKDLCFQDLLDFIASNPLTTRQEIDTRFNNPRARTRTICLNWDLWLLKEKNLIGFQSVIIESKFTQIFYLRN